MKIKFNATEDQISLIKAMGSKNKIESLEAQEAFAAVLGPIVQEVILQAGTTSRIFTDYPFGEDDNPEYPLDLYYQRTAGTVIVWSQTQAGGLASSLLEGYQSLKMSTYELDSAVSIYKRYASKVRLPAIAKAIEWMGQEITLKRNLNGWSVITIGAAQASTNGLQHIIRANTPGVFQIHDLNDLIIRAKRVNSSFIGGTPAGLPAEGVTDLFVSPEMKGQIRSFSYQPMNTRGVPNSDESTVLGLPDDVRSEIFRAAGASSLWGISITDLNELGINQSYNTLLANYAGSTTFKKRDGTAAATFNGATEELIFAFDMSRDGFVRPVITNGLNGGTVSVAVDDQFVTRQGKLGWYSAVNEGAMLVDARCVFGLIV